MIKGSLTFLGKTVLALETKEKRFSDWLTKDKFPLRSTFVCCKYHKHEINKTVIIKTTNYFVGSINCVTIHYTTRNQKYPLREKCPYSEIFWSIFSCIGTEYGEILRISPYSVRMRENTDLKNAKYGHFLRRDQHLRMKTKHRYNIRILEYCKFRSRQNNISKIVCFFLSTDRPHNLPDFARITTN